VSKKCHPMSMSSFISTVAFGPRDPVPQGCDAPAGKPHARACPCATGSLANPPSRSSPHVISRPGRYDSSRLSRRSFRRRWMIDRTRIFDAELATMAHHEFKPENVSIALTPFRNVFEMYVRSRGR
jgi:hypothetical protein